MFYGSFSAGDEHYFVIKKTKKSTNPKIVKKQLQIQDKADSISPSGNTLEKVMNPIFLFPTIVGQTGLFNLGIVTGLEYGKL